MYKISGNYQNKRNISNGNYIRYSPSEISTVNAANSEMYLSIPTENSVISLLNSYLEVNFDVLNAATKNT